MANCNLSDVSKALATLYHDEVVRQLTRRSVLDALTPRWVCVEAD